MNLHKILDLTKYNEYNIIQDKIMDEFIILIPALNPPKEILRSYLYELRNMGFSRILLVNDGSRAEYDEFFDKLIDEGFDVFIHYKNFGKGRALKNSFNYILNNYEDFSYVITVDSDGQHKASDVQNIANIVKKSDVAMYLGSRDFNEEGVPFKSSFGNKTTSFIYKLMFYDKIGDTQTGLRAIPKAYLADFLDLPGERFEYEINMLINSSQTKKKIIEIPIETVYFDNNSETHFHPIKDSFKIYRVMLGTFFKFIISSLSSFLVDIGAFTVLTKLLPSILATSSKVIWASTALARIVSGIFNYNVNKNLVFADDKKEKSKFIKYVSLWLCQLILSAFFVDMIFERVNMNASVIKLIVDTIIFLLSFTIQNKFIFNGSE